MSKLRSGLALFAVIALAHSAVADTSPRANSRGAWQASPVERWRSAIENYVSSVKPGNQTPIGNAAVAWATYISAMHTRIHPIYSDWFLASLDAQPQSGPMNDPHLYTAVEIVLSGDGRSIVKMGVVKTSGVAAFDVAALDTVTRAMPFAQPPASILSSDGRAYVRWEFHRDDVAACSTINVHPYILNLAAP
jgi:hypothetical protein